MTLLELTDAQALAIIVSFVTVAALIRYAFDGQDWDL